MLVCDEVHVFSAPMFTSAVLKINFHYSVGLTATDDRKDGLAWVFRSLLGKQQVSFSGEVMTPIIKRITAPACGLDDEEWRMAYCDSFRKMTWLSACRTCQYFHAYPDKCGGKLKLSDNKPQWDRLNRSAFIETWSNQDEYHEWVGSLVDKLIGKGRRCFIFADGRKFLIRQYERQLRLGNKRNVGLFLGKKVDASESSYEHQRKTAVHQQVTFATYGVARKGLDVREKDCAVLCTPVSDVRQIVGRVRRTSEDKKTPVVLIPIVPEFQSHQNAWRQILRQCREAQWPVTYS
jgi:hypothetical protein